MFLRGAIRSGTKGRRNAIFGGAMAAILSIPLILWGLPSNPPTGESGAAVGNGGSTCGTNSCHFHGTATAGVITATNLTGTYTPGGAAIPITVTLGSDTAFGFEMSAVSGSGTSEVQAGSFTPGTGSDVAMGTTTTDSGIQYIRQSSQGSSFAFSWTPPGASVGTVTFNLAGVSSAGIIFATTFTMTPAATPPPTPTLSATTGSFTFTVNGANPPSQTTSITINPTTAATTVTTAASTTSGGSWLSAMPPSGSVGPLTVTVGVNATGLAAGTYTGSVSITPPSASGITALSLPVTLTVNTRIPPTVPTLDVNGSATPTGLTFTATAGGTATAQSVSVAASDSSAVTFNAAPTVATPSGGSWLTVGGSTSTATGTTPASESIGVVLTGLAAGTYQGSVTFTSSGVSNSPVTLPVTLTVNSSTPPPTSTGERFNLVVVDRQSGGADWLLLDGSGSVNSSGTPSGSGFFTRYRFTSTSSERGGLSTAITSIVCSGTWTPTSVTSYTPNPGSTSGGTLVLQVQITYHGGSCAAPTSTTTPPPPSTGKMTIISNSNSSGVTLTFTGGQTFAPPPNGTNPVLVGTESITSGSGGGTDDGGTGTGGTGTGGTPDH